MTIPIKQTIYIKDLEDGKYNICIGNDIKGNELYVGNIVKKFFSLHIPTKTECTKTYNMMGQESGTREIMLNYETVKGFAYYKIEYGKGIHYGSAIHYDRLYEDKSVKGITSLYKNDAKSGYEKVNIEYVIDKMKKEHPDKQEWVEHMINLFKT